MKQILHLDTLTSSWESWLASSVEDKMQVSLNKFFLIFFMQEYCCKNNVVPPESAVVATELASELLTLSPMLAIKNSNFVHPPRNVQTEGNSSVPSTTTKKTKEVKEYHCTNWT